MLFNHLQESKISFPKHRHPNLHFLTFRSNISLLCKHFSFLDCRERHLLGSYKSSLQLLLYSLVRRFLNIVFSLWSQWVFPLIDCSCATYSCLDSFIFKASHIFHLKNISIIVFLPEDTLSFIFFFSPFTISFSLSIGTGVNGEGEGGGGARLFFTPEYCSAFVHAKDNDPIGWDIVFLYFVLKMEK